MNVLEQILVIPNLLSDVECDLFVDYFKNNENNEHYESSTNAITGERIQTTFKCVRLSADHDCYKLAHRKIEQAINLYITHLTEFKSYNVYGIKENLNYPHAIRILKYEKGASIHPHTDFNEFAHASCTLNLTDNYTGGDFSFFNKKHNIKLGKGDALIFPNSHFWVHEVLEITSGVRFSINSFILSIPEDKRRMAKEWAMRFIDDKKFNIS